MKDDKVSEACSMNGKEEKCLQHFDEKSEETTQLRGRRRSWEDNIKNNLRNV
jgi:hypothetical protein